MYRINADLILNSRAFYNPMKERQIDLRGIVSRLDYFAVSSTRGMQIKKMINVFALDIYFDFDVSVFHIPPFPYLRFLNCCRNESAFLHYQTCSL